MSKFVLNPGLLPTHSDLMTAHWPSDQQHQFTTAVDGIRAAPWFQVGCAQLTEADKDRVARSFAFAALGSIRRKASAPLASDSELMQDNKGLGRTGDYVTLKSTSSVSVNPLLNLEEDIDTVVPMLLHLSEVKLDDSSTQLARTVAINLAERGGAVTWSTLIDAFDAHPSLQAFAAGLRRVVLPVAAPTLANP